MSYSNNSRNIANLLRFQPLEPIKQINQTKNIPNQPPSRQRQQIPIQDVFTPDDSQSQKRISRRIAPLSSGGNNRNQQAIRMSKNNHRNDLEYQTLRARLDQIIKYYDQRQNNLESKLMIRLNQLQNFVMKEVPKIDNTIMISSDIVGFKQALKQVRRQQEMQSNQINAIKASNRQRSNSEALMSQNAKDKQKMTVLFMELVRLGDTIQKMGDQMNGSTRTYQSRIQDLQQKLINSQKNLSIISQRTASGSDVLNDFGDRLMGKIQNAQTNLLSLGKQQVKLREIINNVTSQNQRIGQDLNTMITNMQSDFQNKLQNRMNVTLNRLMGQHQERIKAQQEIRKNLDIMERIHQEKQQADKYQHKTLLNDMDVAVRNQFIRKQQSIKGLQNTMEQQFRTLISEIQNQGNKRKQQQNSYRFELKKVQQNFRKQNDLFRTNQTDLVDKISDMIKAEVNTRTFQQNKLKQVTKTLGDMLADDLNVIKDAVSLSNKKLTSLINQVSSESSERAGQLSHYVDQQVKKVFQTATQKYGKMKSLMTKLSQHFKTHLHNSEINRKNHQSRLGAVEQDFQKLKTQVNTQIDQFYNDLQARLKQQKQFVETVVFKKNNQLTLRVNKLQQYTNQYFEVLKNGIQDNKQLLHNNKSKQGNSRNQQSEDQIKQLRLVIFDIKKITEEIKTQNTQSYRKLDREIQQLEQRTKQTIVELTNNINNKINKNSEKTNQIQEIVSDLTIKVNSIRAESGSETAISSDRLKKLSDQLDEIGRRSKETEDKLNNQSSRTDQEFIKIKSDITVLKGEVGALDDDLKKLGNSK